MRVVIPAHVPCVEGQPFYSDLGFLADLCLLGFLGITARDSMTSLEGFLARLFCSDFGAGFILRLAGTFFLGVRIFTVRFLALNGVFLKDSNVSFMPAWAIDTAFWTSSMRLFIRIPYHDRAAQLSLALTIHTF